MAVPLCSGDCDGDGKVAVNELVLGVDIALGDQVLAQCPAMDSQDSNAVQIADLVRAVGNALNGCPVVTCTPPAGGRCVEIDPGDGAQDALGTALQTAQPNDVIFIKAGTYEITKQLSLLTVNDVTIAGEGMNRTVLSFKNEVNAEQGIFVSASNGFTLQDIGLEDAPNDLIEITASDGVTIRDVRGEWTNGPATSNGSYAFYPSQCRNILIEDSIAEGASDTGIYVGQSRDIIVRRNRSELNVSGIEIENSVDADVDDNVVTQNTGGVLVFDTPGPPAQGGRRTRVFNNQIYENNTPNFAASGNTVAVVPTGTGSMILANDQVEFFGNTFRDNNSTHIILISYNVAAAFGEPAPTNPEYDPYSETVFIHDNTFIGGGTDPDPRLVAFGLETLNGGTPPGTPLPDILYDGDVNKAEEVNGQLPDNLRTCVQQSGATILNLDVADGLANPNHDLSLLSCTQPPLQPVVLAGQRHVVITAGAEAQDQIDNALLTAQPGDDILIKAGTYELTKQLSLLGVAHVTLRGEGMAQTILRFDGLSAEESLLVESDDFSLQDLAIEDSLGDQLKIEGADGVRIQRVRTEWTNGPNTNNGGYGIYPVASRDVLVEDSVAKGASDTGVYVGQSQHIVVRGNDAEDNVAGIEIENSTDADVHDNLSTNNAGGILVFNLPGEQVYGARTRVFDNMSVTNNTQNFAPSGNIVAGVPTGTGFMVLANNQVEVFGNTFSDNNTTQVLSVSYNSAVLLAGLTPPSDPLFNPYSEALFVHGNTYMGGGTKPPDDPAFAFLAPLIGTPVPQIVYDGDVNPADLKNGVLPDTLRTCIQEPGPPPPTFADLNVATLFTTPNVTTDLTPLNCSLAALPQIVIPGLP
jgi:parallel beta-helix repeat protein